MSVNWHNLFFISVGPPQTESMRSFTPHFTQGGLALHPGANGGLNQSPRPRRGADGRHRLRSGTVGSISAAQILNQWCIASTDEAQRCKVLCVQCQLNNKLDDTWWGKQPDLPPSDDSPNALIMKESCYNGGVIVHFKWIGMSPKTSQVLFGVENSRGQSDNGLTWTLFFSLLKGNLRAVWLTTAALILTKLSAYSVAEFSFSIQHSDKPLLNLTKLWPAQPQPSMARM